MHLDLRWTKYNRYVWQPTRSGEPALVPADWRALEYHLPLEKNPRLFWTFAGVEPGDRDGIRRFADEYGTLGVTVDVLRQMTEPPQPEFDEDVCVWEAAREGARIRRGRGEKDATPPAPPIDLEERKELAADRALDRYRYGETLGVWDEHLRRVRRAVEAVGRMNRGDRKTIEGDRGAVIALCNWALATHLVGFGVGRRPGATRLEFHLNPRTLLAGMWLQFILEVTAGKGLRLCERCGAWLDEAGPNVRTDRRYCGDACRAAVYRSRKAEAARLAGGGLSPREIADRVGSTGHTVRGWLKGKKK